jgi:hypothetical protein
MNLQWSLIAQYLWSLWYVMVMIVIWDHCDCAIRSMIVPSGQWLCHPIILSCS